MTCIGVYRRSDQVFCIRTTAIQTVQPACPRADTCGTEEAPPSGAAAKAVRAPRTCEPRIHGRWFGTDARIDLDPDPRLRRECTDSPRLKPTRHPADIRWHLCADVRRRCGLDGPCVQVDGGTCLSGGGYFGSNSLFNANAPAPAGF